MIDSNGNEVRVDPYEITAEAMAAASEFVVGINALIKQTGVTFEASYGGVSVGAMLIGNLRATREGVFVIDVRHD